METVKTCSLGQIMNALFEVGGQYRRNVLRNVLISCANRLNIYYI